MEPMEPWAGDPNQWRGAEWREAFREYFEESDEALSIAVRATDAAVRQLGGAGERADLAVFNLVMAFELMSDRARWRMERPPSHHNLRWHTLARRHRTRRPDRFQGAC